MRICINAVTIHIDRSQHEANVQSTERRQVRRKRGQLNPQQKVKLVYLKQIGIWSESPTYIQPHECDVDNDTECWVYFDARYMDPNLCYDKDTDSWFHYSTPGLFKNVTNLHFKDSIKSWVSAQPHSHIIII